MDIDALIAGLATQTLRLAVAQQATLEAATVPLDVDTGLAQPTPDGDALIVLNGAVRGRLPAEAYALITTACTVTEIDLAALVRSALDAAAPAPAPTPDLTTAYTTPDPLRIELLVGYTVTVDTAEDSVFVEGDGEALGVPLAPGQSVVITRADDPPPPSAATH